MQPAIFFYLYDFLGFKFFFFSYSFSVFNVLRSNPDKEMEHRTCVMVEKENRGTCGTREKETIELVLKEKFLLLNPLPKCSFSGSFLPSTPFISIYFFSWPEERKKWVREGREKKIRTEREREREEKETELELNPSPFFPLCPIYPPQRQKGFVSG